MSNIIECICKLLPNKVYVTIPSLEEAMLYVVTGVLELDTNEPAIVVKKKEEGAKEIYNLPCRLIGEIIIKDFGNGEDKDKICRSQL